HVSLIGQGRNNTYVVNWNSASANHTHAGVVDISDLGPAGTKTLTVNDQANRDDVSTTYMVSAGAVERNSPVAGGGYLIERVTYTANLSSVTLNTGLGAGQGVGHNTVRAQGSNVSTTISTSAAAATQIDV